MHRSAFVLVLVPFLASTGCRHRNAAVQPFSESVTVYVTNNYNQPMEVYVSASGATHRLGSVNPGMEGRFQIPHGLIGNGTVDFYAFPVADARQVARPGSLLLVRGQRVEFNIATPLFSSTVTVRE